MTVADPDLTKDPSQRAGVGGVLLDMDGTLIDTEPMWHDAQVQVLAEYGATWTFEQSLNLIGKPVLWAAEHIVTVTGVPLTAQEMMDQMIAGVLRLEAEQGLPWRPGAQALLALLAEQEIPAALVTSSYRLLTTQLVKEAPAGSLRGVIAAEDVIDHKPAPDPYLAGAALLGVHPSRCVAIEDSPSGLRAALTAGCRTLAIPVNLDLPAEPGLSRLLSLHDVDLAMLQRIAGGEDVDLLED